jgi:hypothetical protein
VRISGGWAGGMADSLYSITASVAALLSLSGTAAKYSYCITMVAPVPNLTPREYLVGSAGYRLQAVLSSTKRKYLKGSFYFKINLRNDKRRKQKRGRGRWMNFCIHLRSSNVRHIGTVEATAFKSMASRSKSMERTPYLIALKVLGSIAICGTQT